MEYVIREEPIIRKLIQKLYEEGFCYVSDKSNPVLHWIVKKDYVYGVKKVLNCVKNMSI